VPNTQIKQLESWGRDSVAVYVDKKQHVLFTEKTGWETEITYLT